MAIKDGITNLPADLLPEATAFVYELILARQGKTKPLDQDAKTAVTELITELWQLSSFIGVKYLTTVAMFDATDDKHYLNYEKKLVSKNTSNRH